MPPTSGSMHLPPSAPSPRAGAPALSHLRPRMLRAPNPLMAEKTALCCASTALRPFGAVGAASPCAGESASDRLETRRCGPSDGRSLELARLPPCAGAPPPCEGPPPCDPCAGIAIAPPLGPCAGAPLPCEEAPPCGPCAAPTPCKRAPPLVPDARAAAACCSTALPTVSSSAAAAGFPPRLKWAIPPAPFFSWLPALDASLPLRRSPPLP